MSDKKTENAYKYFIYSIKEYAKIENCNLENRRLDSLRALLKDTLDLYSEIQGDFGDKSKLEKSLKYLFDAIGLYCRENPVLRHPILEKDINNLELLLKKNDMKDIKIFLAISSVFKKLNNVNVIKLCIEMVQDKVQNFSDIDKVVEYCISELLYEGFSLKFIDEWLRQTFSSQRMKEATDEESLKELIDSFKELSEKKNEFYEIVLQVSLPTIITEEIRENHILKIFDVVYEELDVKAFLEANKGFDKFFESSRFVYLEVKIAACDKYKSIDLVKLPLENYTQMYSFIDTKITMVNGCLVQDQGSWTEIPLHNNTSYLKSMTSREKEDIFDFIELRDVLRLKNIESFDIEVIERVINLLQKMPDFTRENRLLNTWLSLENIVRFYNKDSIIEKIRQIVPRVICLYFVKNKMNLLWEKVFPYIEKGILKDLDECKSLENKLKYDKESFALFLIDSEKATKLSNFFTNNVIIQRKIAELNFVLSNPEGLGKMLNYTFDSVKHDLNHIYRLRNKLVHSGGGSMPNIELYTNKLHMYVNGIIGTLIYHIKRSPESTIAEILYSIVQTYDKYEQWIKSIPLKDETGKVKLEETKEKVKENIRPYAFPPYLYL